MRFIFIAFIVTVSSIGLLFGCNDQEQQTIVKLQSEQQTKLDYLPRDLLFQEPVQYQGRISPNGSKVSWLSFVDGALHLFIADSDNPQSARQFTFGENGVAIHEWSPNSAFVLYTIYDTKRDSSQTYSLNVFSKESIVLSLAEKDINVRLLKISPNWPNTALVSITDQNRQNTGLYRINLRDGKRKLVRKNSGFSKWVIDDDLHARIGIRKNHDLSQDWYLLFDNGQQQKLLHVPAKDVAGTRPLRLDPSGTILYMLDKRGRQYSVFSQINLTENNIKIVGQVAGHSISRVLFHPVTARPMAWWYNAALPQWVSSDQQFQTSLEIVRNTLGSSFYILATTSNMQQLVIYSSRPDRPGKYSLLNRNTNTITTMFETAPAQLIPEKSRSIMVRIPANDGFNMIGYFSPTISQDDPQKVSAPLIIIPNIWPGSRKYYSYDPQIQWLNSRGYSVLELNTRGAGFLGIEYDRQQNNTALQKSSTDLIYAANWLVDQGWAQKDQISAIGTQFGGLGVLKALADPLNPFKCAVTLDAVIDIGQTYTWLKEKRPAAAISFSKFLKNQDGQFDIKQIYQLSPKQHTKNVNVPLLLIQTGHSSGTEISTSIQYAKDIAQQGTPVTLAIIKGEYEDLYENKTNIPALTIYEQFFANCLGGKAEPIGDSFLDYDVKLLIGAQHMPTLETALNNPQTQ